MPPALTMPGIAAMRLGQPPGVAVILGEPIDHPVRAVGEGDEPGGGDDPRLAHAAAQQLSRPPRAGDERAVADDEGADRAGEALREAERDRVGRGGELARRHPEGHRGVEEPRPVDMERHAVAAGDRSDRG